MALTRRPRPGPLPRDVDDADDGPSHRRGERGQRVVARVQRCPGHDEKHAGPLLVLAGQPRQAGEPDRAHGPGRVPVGGGVRGSVGDRDPDGARSDSHLEPHPRPDGGGGRHLVHGGEGRDQLARGQVVTLLQRHHDDRLDTLAPRGQCRHACEPGALVSLGGEQRHSEQPADRPGIGEPGAQGLQEHGDCESEHQAEQYGERAAWQQ